jgi:hypothetical protein
MSCAILSRVNNQQRHGDQRRDRRGSDPAGYIVIKNRRHPSRLVTIYLWRLGEAAGYSSRQALLLLETSLTGIALYIA